MTAVTAELERGQSHVVREQHLEERRVAQIALRVQRLDEPLERHLLMGEAAEQPSRARGASSSANVGSPATVVRSTSVLVKKPISGSVSSWWRPETGVPTTMSSCARVAVEQRLERGQQDDEERDAAARGPARAAASTSSGGSGVRRWAPR